LTVLEISVCHFWLGLPNWIYHMWYVKLLKLFNSGVPVSVVTKDYAFFVCRLFAPQLCSRCLGPVSAHELVMYARQHIYHVDCFVCTVCECRLTTGQHFAMHRNAVYCQVQPSAHHTCNFPAAVLIGRITGLVCPSLCPFVCQSSCPAEVTRKKLRKNLRKQN